MINHVRSSTCINWSCTWYVRCHISVLSITWQPRRFRVRGYLVLFPRHPVWFRGYDDHWKSVFSLFVPNTNIPVLTWISLMITYSNTVWREISFKYQHAWSGISGCKVEGWPRVTAFLGARGNLLRQSVSRHNDRSLKNIYAAKLHYLNKNRVIS